MAKWLVSTGFNVFRKERGNNGSLLRAAGGKTPRNLVSENIRAFKKRNKERLRVKKGSFSVRPLESNRFAVLILLPLE